MIFRDIFVATTTNRYKYISICERCCQQQFYGGIKMRTNADIRKVAKDNGIKLWQIAKKLGISDGNFSRKLRDELSEGEKDRILTIIAELAKGVKK